MNRSQLRIIDGTPSIIAAVLVTLLIGGILHAIYSQGGGRADAPAFVGLALGGFASVSLLLVRAWNRLVRKEH